MEGGSWDKISHRIAETSSRLCASDDPLRIMFGEHLAEVSIAMHSIERVDSSDYVWVDEIEAILSVLKPRYIEYNQALMMANVHRLRKRQ